MVSQGKETRQKDVNRRLTPGHFGAFQPACWLFNKGTSISISVLQVGNQNTTRGDSRPAFCRIRNPASQIPHLRGKAVHARAGRHCQRDFQNSPWDRTGHKHSPTHCGGWLPLLHCPACRHSALGSSPGCSWKPWLQWYMAFVPTVYSLPKTTPFFGALGTPQERAGKKEEGEKKHSQGISFQFYHGFVVSKLKAQIPSFPI